MIFTSGRFSVDNDSLCGEYVSKAIVAVERRFGQSIKPYVIRATGHGTYRIKNVEVGGWIEFLIHKNRLRVTHEQYPTSWC